MKWKITLALAVLWSLLTGCGGEGSNTPQDEQNAPQAKEYSEAELINWKEACIDENLPLARSNRDQCMEIHEDEERCERDYQNNLALLDQAWKIVKRKAFVDLETCVADFRTYDDFCKAKYEEALSFYIDMECRSAAQWN